MTLRLSVILLAVLLPVEAFVVPNAHVSSTQSPSTRRTTNPRSIQDFGAGPPSLTLLWLKNRYETAEGEYIDKDINNVFLANQKWKFTKLVEDEDFFVKLGSHHSPPYMWIGTCKMNCRDTLLLSLPLTTKLVMGDLFY